MTKTAPPMTIAKSPSAPDPIDVAVGARIRDHRRAVGISQEKLGEALGVTFQQVQKYERGTNRISASMMARAAAALNCTVSDLMGEGQPAPLARDVRAMIEAFQKLDAAQKRVVLGLAQSLGK